MYVTVQITEDFCNARIEWRKLSGKLISEKEYYIIFFGFLLQFANKINVTILWYKRFLQGLNFPRKALQIPHVSWDILKRNYKISPELGKLRSLKISFHLSWSCGLTWLAKIVWLSDSNSNWINWRTVHSEVSIMRGNWTYLLKNQPTEDFISLFRSSAELSCPLCSICHWKLINSSQYLLEELLN